MNRRNFLKSLLGGTAAVAAGIQSSPATVRAIAPEAFTLDLSESHEGPLRKFFEDWTKLIHSNTVDVNKVRAVRDNVVMGRNRVVNHEPVAGLPVTKIKNSGIFGRHPEETLSKINLGYEVSFKLPDFLKEMTATGDLK